MEYEVRPWFDDEDCLYTTDSRVKDLAVQSAGLRVTASYFKAPGDRVPFAWDIVGRHEIVEEIAARFLKLRRVQRTGAR